MSSTKFNLLEQYEPCELSKCGTRLANGFFMKGHTPKGNRPKGAKGILGLLRDSVLDVLLSEDDSGLLLIQSDIAALKSIDRANLAAKLIPKSYDIALSVADDPVPIVLEALDVQNKKPAIVEGDNNGRSVLSLV